MHDAVYITDAVCVPEKVHNAVCVCVTEKVHNTVCVTEKVHNAVCIDKNVYNTVCVNLRMCMMQCVLKRIRIIQLLSLIMQILCVSMRTCVTQCETVVHTTVHNAMWVDENGKRQKPNKQPCRFQLTPLSSTIPHPPACPWA